MLYIVDARAQLFCRKQLTPTGSSLVSRRINLKMAGAVKEKDSYPPFVLGKPRFDQVEARRGL